MTRGAMVHLAVVVIALITGAAQADPLLETPMLETKIAAGTLPSDFVYVVARPLAAPHGA